MRQFRTDSEWAYDEQGWRVGRVFTDGVRFIQHPESGTTVPVTGAKRVEFFDRRYVQVGSQILTALERQEVGLIEMGEGT